MYECRMPWWEWMHDSVTCGCPDAKRAEALEHLHEVEAAPGASILNPD